MRLLLIEHDARFRSLLRHHVSCEWPDAEFVSYNPLVKPPLPPEFLAQGYDAVLLCAHWGTSSAARGEGVAWLQDLAARPGFAPIVFLADRIDDDTARRARVFGAFGVLARSRVEHEDLIDLLREASRTQQRALADWRVSPAGGGLAPLRHRAHSRLPLRAASGRRIGVAALSGREREGRRADRGQGHALDARRLGRRINPSSASCRNTRSRGACTIRTSCAATSWAWRTTTPTSRWNTSRMATCAAASAPGSTPRTRCRSPSRSHAPCRRCTAQARCTGT